MCPIGTATLWVGHITSQFKTDEGIAYIPFLPELESNQIRGPSPFISRQGLYNFIKVKHYYCHPWNPTHQLQTFNIYSAK